MELIIICSYTELLSNTTATSYLSQVYFGAMIIDQGDREPLLKRQAVRVYIVHPGKEKA